MEREIISLLYIYLISSTEEAGRTDTKYLLQIMHINNARPSSIWILIEMLSVGNLSFSINNHPNGCWKSIGMAGNYCRRLRVSNSVTEQGLRYLFFG